MFAYQALVLCHLQTLDVPLPSPRGLSSISTQSSQCLQAFGYLFRKLPEQNLPLAVRHVLAEVAATASEGRVHGAAHLLAESVLGPANGLHSRASTLLATLFAQGLLADGCCRDDEQPAQVARELPNYWPLQILKCFPGFCGRLRVCCCVWPLFPFVRTPRLSILSSIWFIH
jgi:hypothetical protein